MSDYTLEQQNRILEEYHARLEKGIPSTDRQAEEMEQLSESAKVAKKRLEDLNQEFKKLGKGMTDWTKSMYDGQQGMSAMTGSVDAAAAAIGLLVAMIPGFGLVKLAVMGATAAIAVYVKKASEQADKLFDTYQKLNENGMATAGGMTKIYNNMQELGYGIEDLKKMQELLKDNSEALANFGGTAATGMQAFVNAAGEIQHSNAGRAFQQLGKTPDDVNRGIAQFIRGQQELGIKNKHIYENLADRAANYVTEIDKLQKLTGEDSESIQQKLDEAYAESAFNQLQYELEERYRSTGDLQVKAALERNRKLAAVLPGEIRKEFIRGVAGDITAMTKTMAVAPGAVDLINSQNYTAEEYIDTVTTGVRNVRKAYGTLFKYNATDGWMFPIKDMSEIESRYGDQQAQQQEDQAKLEQKAQKEALDPDTKAVVDLRISQQNTRNALQNFVNKGINPAITAMEAIQKAGGAAIRLVPGTGPTGPGTGSEARGAAIRLVPGTGSEAKPGGAAIRLVPGTGPSTGDLGAKGGSSRTTAELKKMGLNIRSGDVQADGRLLDDRLINLAKMAQSQISGFGVITSLNDNFHAERYSTSQHALGRAMDFTLDHRPSDEEGQRIAQQLKSMGASFVIDEYNHPSAGATGGHIHAQVSAADGFTGTLSGPSTGYRPDIVMHGDERLTITPSDEIFQNAGNSYDIGSMTIRATKLDQLVDAFRQKYNTGPLAEKLEKLGELSFVMKKQLDISTKILQASR